MYTMSMLKLGPLILIVNLFFSISAIAESKYAEKTKDIIRGELRKFIFSEKHGGATKSPYFGCQ